MRREIFLVDPAEGGDAAVRQIAQQAQAAQLEARHVRSAEEAVHALSAAVRVQAEPAAVLIGPHVDKPLAAARAVHAAWPGHIVFAPQAPALPALRRELSVAPMIGENWSLCEAGDARLARVLREAVRAGVQRRQLRTTLDRANLAISAREAVDPGRYRALFLSDRFLASLLRQAPGPVVALDARDAVAAWNRGAEQVFGLDARDALGRPVARLPGWPSALGAALEAARAAVQPVEAEVRVGAGADERHFHASVSAVRDDAGSYAGASVIMHEVTTVARALAAEQAARAHAEQMSRMKDEFLATLSHELRTPLSAVLSWAQILQMRRGEAELEQGLEVIQRNARMQAQLIDDLLDLSRIVTGQPFLDMQPVSLVEIAERALAVVAPAAAAKALSLHRSYDESIATVHGDAKRLQQVLWNLLANAVKFTARGGRVELGIRQAASCIEVTVADTGQGIEAEFLPHLFERFRQADASIRRRHGGLGLGLALAKQLVELHGGTIAGASPGPGRGSTFTFQLPVLALAERSVPPRPAAPATPAPTQDAAPSLAGLRVLVVEDEKDSRAAIERILGQWGAVTASAAAVEEALSLVERFGPHVLVSDIGMPGRDGYDLIRTLRLRGLSAQSLPALALTAFARHDDARRALEAGFQAHLAKPADAGRLVHAVAQLAPPHRK